jgi:hypothetical protein
VKQRQELLLLIHIQLQFTHEVEVVVVDDDEVIFQQMIVQIEIIHQVIMIEFVKQLHQLELHKQQQHKQQHKQV